jgi:AcrR family transcriptional regulator
MASTETNGKTRTRLSTQARQQQLLEIGARVFASVPYDQAQIEDIASHAEVSASLIYHYFANKRDYFAAVVDQAIDDLGRMTELPPDLPPLARFRAGMDGYIDYIQAYEHAYRAMHRGRQSGDERVQAAIERNTQRQIDRICAVFYPHGNPPAEMQLAIRGALAANIATCLDWLDHRQIDRTHLRELIINTYIGAIKGANATEHTTEHELQTILTPTAAA